MIEISRDITSTKDLNELIAEYKREKPRVIGFDTEGDGLNIKHNKPFLLVFGFITNNHHKIYSYTLDFELAPKHIIKECMYVFEFMQKMAKEIVGHNVTFDMHMMDNIGYPIKYPKKLTDTQIYIRLSHYALKQSEGGPPMDLKGYTYRFIDKSARNFQDKLKTEIRNKRRKATQELKAKLAEHEVPESFKVSGKEKKWTMGMLNKFFDDSLNDLEDLPEDIKEVVKKHREETPNPNNYRLLDRDNITEYAHYDLFYTLGIWKRLRLQIKEKGQEAAFKTETNLIPSLYELEKTGAYLDLDYAYKAKERTKTYIKKRRKDFQELVGEPISVNQHEKLKTIMFNRFNINMTSTDAKHIEKALNMDIDETAKEILRTALELRTLEKWYPTYILRWINEGEKFGNVVYPTYHATGTVTGRISSDFQQFPKNALKTKDGEELFHPREMFYTPKDYDIFFLDYAAMEMRLLAIYTILVDGGDINLCRVFKPFKCHTKDGDYYLNENPKEKWSPVDPHALTTKNAFGLTGNESDFKTWRYLGKTANFAIIYGATGKAIAEQLHLPSVEGDKLYRGFFKAFPKVRSYVEYVERHIREFGYAENLFGRKYYGINAHKARNYLIQGSGADYTKHLLPQLTDLLSGYKSKVQGYLHDEFSFLIHKDERHLVPKLKEIMEQLNTDIIMKVDVEYSTTNWREKQDYAIT